MKGLNKEQKNITHAFKIRLKDKWMRDVFRLHKNSGDSPPANTDALTRLHDTMAVPAAG